MKLQTSRRTAGFTVAELMVALGVSTLVLGATITSSVALQKSFSAIDDYFGTHMQQIRIVDYLGRDVKRGLTVTTSADLQTVTMTIPDYIVKAGDPDANSDPVTGNIGKPRTPTVTRTSTGLQVGYGSTTSTVVYSISGNSVIRTENGAVTTIAASTDQLVPQTTDVELANTEYANTTVTFRPIFSSGNAAMSRTGTTLFSKAYLRNKRRG
jgi:Tfp pilus assembly protein PilW